MLCKCNIINRKWFIINCSISNARVCIFLCCKSFVVNQPHKVNSDLLQWFCLQWKSLGVSCLPGHAVQQAIELPVIWDTMASMRCHYKAITAKQYSPNDELNIQDDLITLGELWHFITTILNISIDAIYLKCNDEARWESLFVQIAKCWNCRPGQWGVWDQITCLFEMLSDVFVFVSMYVF